MYLLVGSADIVIAGMRPCLFGLERIAINEYCIHTVITMGRIRILFEFWRFLAVRKKFWLLPIVTVLFVLGLLLVVAEGSAVAPFIYALF